MPLLRAVSAFVVVLLSVPLPVTVFAADPAPAEDAAPAADDPAAAAEPASAQASTADEDAPAASDAPVRTDPEAELATLAPRLAPGDELQWLDAAGRKFAAFRRTPRKGPPKGAILIVPAPAELLDQRELTHSLRLAPPAGGFVTLALQPPLGPVEAAASAAADEKEEAPAEDAADKESAATADTVAATVPAVPAVHADFCPRVAAAYAALEASLEGAQTPLVAIAAADASVPAVLACYPDGLPAGVNAFAAIGRWQGDLGGLAVPAIEFVPGLDPAAVAAADRRAALPLAEDAPPRRRVDLDGFDRRLDGAGTEVAKRLRGWLERLPPPAAQAAGPAGAPPTPNVSS